MQVIQERCRELLRQEQAEITARFERPHLVKGANGLDPTRWGVLQQMRERLHSVERALQRLDEGRYGQCLRCHCRINTERLLVLPDAEFCIDCQRRKEQKEHKWPTRRAA